MCSPRRASSPHRVALLSAIALLGLATAAAAEQVSREQDIVELRLGQKVQVDDGSCPAGQIKEISGTTLTANGVTRARKCVPRFGAPKK
jgi:Na+-transporting NADH:ubiquinone oxidoreductase subunit NqrC